MNTFAKYLFQILFGWTRDALRQLTDPGVLDSWLATHWLTALIPILLIGTLIDYIVWLARWRPDLAWRSSIHQSMSLLNEEGREMRRFRKGFSKENADIGAIARPLQDAPIPAEYSQAEESAADDDAYYDWQFETPAPAEQPAQRHRRGDRYRKKERKPRTEHRASLLEADDSPVDGLPPVIRKEDAFRAPVYPRASDQDGPK